MAAKWLPGSNCDDEEVLATALLLEREYWKNMKVSVANAIALAFNSE